MTPLWFEFEFGISGVTLSVTVNWYASDDPGATPILADDTFTHMLTDPAVTPDKVYQAVADRAVEVRRGLETYTAIVTQFGGAQGVRIPAP